MNLLFSPSTSLINVKKKKKKRFDILKITKAASRQAEINEHGKQISFRSGSVMKSGKEYKRVKFKIEDIKDEDR